MSEREIRGWRLIRSRMSRSLSSGAHSRDPLAHPGYKGASDRIEISQGTDFLEERTFTQNSRMRRDREAVAGLFEI
jgi:hypothetical protein